MFKTLKARDKIKKNKKLVDFHNAPVTRKELLGVQKTATGRTDAALMGIAAITKLLVDNKITTYDKVKEEERNMTEILLFIRKAMEEGYKEFGLDSKPEDIEYYTHEKAVTFGIDKEILINIFNIKPNKSLIIKPNQVKVIKPGR